jgi:hypothetical protein
MCLGTLGNHGNAGARGTLALAGFEGYFRELSAGLIAAGESADAALTVRRELATRYDIEVLGPPMVRAS